ncbi:MAG: hypothetical protein ACW98D_20255, partial [Promethearchaeota archaeon]
ANIEVGKIVQLTPVNLPTNFYFYFANDFYELLDGYEQTGGALTNPTIAPNGNSSVNSTNYGLNDIWDYPGFVDFLQSKMLENKGIRVRLNGYASSAGTTDANQTLSDKRIISIENWFKTNINSDIKFLEAKSNGDTQADATGTVESRAVKADRAVYVEFEYQPEDDEQIKNATDIKKEKTNTTNEILEKIKRRFHREDEYFEKLKNSDVESDGIIYDTIKQKIKFFHPAFHSTTPEGFNSRLTFLQQCTRQGPTDKGNKSNNLAFGSPPVCILRIGDFYHTKIVMNSLGINYEPLVWDLNPEGIGVQPMIANVEISFKFIGGSSLNGPINKLQNAVSFNYFANSGVYDPRADRFVRKDEIDPKNGLLFDHKNGETNLRGFVDDDQIQPQAKPKTTVPNDAQAVAEKAKEKVESVTTTPVSDEDILKKLFWDVGNNSFGTITLNYTNLSALTQTYEINLEVLLNQSEGYNKVLTTTIDSVGSTVVNSSTIWVNRLATVTTNSNGDSPITFRLTISGNGLSPIIQNLNRFVAKQSCDFLTFFIYQIMDEAQNEALKANIDAETC